MQFELDQEDANSIHSKHRQRQEGRRCIRAVGSVVNGMPAAKRAAVTWLQFLSMAQGTLSWPDCNSSKLRFGTVTFRPSGGRMQGSL